MNEEDVIMPIIIISSDSYKTGREIGEKTAKAAGYAYVDREILGPVSEKTHIKEEKLTKALEPDTSFLGLSSKARNRYLAYIREAVLVRLLEDDVICHGLAAHFYVLGVSHVIKVRVLSDPQQLFRQVSAETGVTSEKMKKRLKREAERQRSWSLEAFGLDETDPSNYDMVISLSQIDPDEAVKTIADMTAYRKFQPMSYSNKCLADKALAGRVYVALIERFPDVTVQADGRAVVVETQSIKREKQKKVETIKDLAAGVEGVGEVDVHVVTDIFRQAAESLR